MSKFSLNFLVSASEKSAMMINLNKENVIELIDYGWDVDNFNTKESFNKIITNRSILNKTYSLEVL